MLIAFAGRARHGKTTAAKFLHERYGFSQKSFAEPLKEMCYNGLVQFPPPVDVEDRLSYDSDRDYWQLRIWEDRSEFSRWLLQFVGTEIGRAIDSKLWIKMAMRDVRAGDDNVFADLRFINEADAIKAVGGIIIKVVRIGTEGNMFRDKGTNATHSSETELDLIQADHTIYSSSVAGIHEALEDFMLQYRVPVARG